MLFNQSARYPERSGFKRPDHKLLIIEFRWQSVGCELRVALTSTKPNSEAMLDGRSCCHERINIRLIPTINKGQVVPCFGAAIFNSRVMMSVGIGKIDHSV